MDDEIVFQLLLVTKITQVDPGVHIRVINSGVVDDVGLPALRIIADQVVAGTGLRLLPLALVLTRALPILAEACVLLMGTTRLSWRRFLIPVFACNFVISLTYAACGEYFEEIDALPWAVVLSGTVPLFIALTARRWLPGLGLTDVEISRPSTADETQQREAGNE